jgi:hypothetical protein
MRKIPALVALAALAIASVVSVSAAIADPCPTGNCFSDPCSGGNCDDPPVPAPYPVIVRGLSMRVILVLAARSRLQPASTPVALASSPISIGGRGLTVAGPTETLDRLRAPQLADPARSVAASTSSKQMELCPSFLAR